MCSVVIKYFETLVIYHGLRQNNFIHFYDMMLLAKDFLLILLLYHVDNLLKQVM